MEEINSSEVVESHIDNYILQFVGVQIAHHNNIRKLQVKFIVQLNPFFCSV